MLCVLRRRRVAIAACAGIGVLAAVLYLLIHDARYEARAEIEVSAANSNGLSADDLAAKVPSPSDSNLRLQAAVQVLQSNSLALAVIDQVGLARDRVFAGRWQQAPGVSRAQWSSEVRDQLERRFSKALSVELLPKSDVVRIAFRCKSPELAASVVNSIVREYRDRSVRSSYESASQVSDWLSGQLEDLKKKARQSQEQLAELERNTGLLGQDETDNIVFSKLSQLDEQLTSLESDRIVKEARYRIAASGDPELLATSAPDATLQVLRTQQAGLRAQYAQMTSKFGKGYPKLGEMTEQLANVDGAINNQLAQLSQRYRNDYEAALHSEQLLRARLEQQKQKAYRLNEDAAQHAILKREVESTQQLYETLQLKLKQAGIAAGLASANIEVIDAAQVPSEPAEPGALVTMLIGLAGGVVLGMGTAVALESLDDSVRSVEEAEQALALPLLGSIPTFDRSRKALAKAGADSLRKPNPLAMLDLPHSQAAESYRAIGNSLLLACRPEQPKVIAVTSALPLEGKTTVAANCAVAFAQHGSKVLLVDADLRRPSLHQLFGVARDPGLLQAVANCSETYDVARESDRQPGLYLVPVGSHVGEAAGALDAKTLGLLIANWRIKYDVILLDTPPVSLVSDALVLAAQADAVLFVIRSDSTSARALRRSCATLQRANNNIPGFVLNAIDGNTWCSYAAASSRFSRRAEAAYYDRNG